MDVITLYNVKGVKCTHGELLSIPQFSNLLSLFVRTTFIFALISLFPFLLSFQFKLSDKSNTTYSTLPNRQRLLA